ncbi:MAG: hypothetical protein QXL94_09010 [Candidatus Parvarchaeum sp.]
MCGILGFVSKNNIGNQKAASLLINGYIAQSARGQQSFGALIGRDGKMAVIRQLSITNFINRFTANKFKDINLCMFHHRMASVGEISQKNTHPFIAGDICLVHNGTWIDSAMFRDDFSDKLTGTTDSEIIAHMINKHGVDTFKEISGSASLVWVNKKESTLNFWRTHTPMKLAYIKEKEILLFASTQEAIEAMVKTLGFKKVAGVFNNYYTIGTEEEYLYKCNINFSSLYVEKVKKYPAGGIIRSYNIFGNTQNIPQKGEIKEKAKKAKIDHSYDCSLPKGYKWNDPTPSVFRDGEEIKL